jgi:hypothetical protein
MRPLGLLSLVLVLGCDRTSVIEPVPPTVQIVTPPCEGPAPLLGQFDPQVPAYIVVYRDGTDAELETGRLSVKYGFQPRFVYTHALTGFSAELTAQVVAEMRCETAVDYVQFVQRVSIGV